MSETLPNLARRQPADAIVCAEVDAHCTKELSEAGIEVHKFDSMRGKGEVPSAVFGTLQKWTFTRAWRYWVCEGPGIPPNYAEELHARFGQEIRVDGHCGCPSPREWFHGFAVGSYHVDTQAGLNALAETLRKVRKDSNS